MKIIWDSKRNWTIVFLILVIGAMVFARPDQRENDREDQTGKPLKFDLADILERDTLRAVTGNNSTSYFLYKGRPLGYEYELLERFAEHLGVELDIIVARDAEQFFRLVNSGKADVIANNLTITQQRQQKVAFTAPINTVHQVLIQRKPDNWWKYTRDQLDRQLIRDPIDLIGKEVHVRKNSSYDMRLQHLSDEIGGTIRVVRHDGTRATEELIQMVSEGKIDYTVADNNVADLNATYFRNIDTETAVSFSQRTAWALRKNAPELMLSINEWLAGISKDGTAQIIYNKYFRNTKAYSRRLDSAFSSINGGAVSTYDDLLRRYAAELGWDWRLLAAQVYKESKFNAQAESWAGARGLMQIVPETAGRFGDSTRMDDPEYNLLIGVRYLQWLQDFWKEIPDSSERIKFVLASYNVGEGHVLDACRLAKKYGANDRVWEHQVDSFMMRKAYPRYYRDEVVYYGYCRGTEPFQYVRDILSIYDHYKTLLPARAGPDA